MAGPQSIKDHGWRQGSVLPTDLAQRVATSRFPDWGTEDRAIVISQDCDVVHGSYEVEPFAELIRAKLSSTENAMTRHGRNPRRPTRSGLRSGPRLLRARSMDHRTQ